MLFMCLSLIIFFIVAIISNDVRDRVKSSHFFLDVMLFLWLVGGLSSISSVKKTLFFIFTTFFYLICMDT